MFSIPIPKHFLDRVSSPSLSVDVKCNLFNVDKRWGVSVSCLSYNIYYTILGLPGYLILTPNFLHLAGYTCGRLIGTLIMESSGEFSRGDFSIIWLDFIPRVLNSNLRSATTSSYQFMPQSPTKIQEQIGVYYKADFMKLALCYVK